MRTSAIVLIAAAALTACGPTVQYHRAPDARIEAGGRWAWSPPDADGLTRREGAITPADSVADMLRSAIRTELEDKGFRLAAPESAQFFVHFHVGQRTVMDTLPPRDDPPQGVRAPGMWGGGYGQPEDLAERTVTWQEGMLVVDAVTADRGIVAWRGLIAGEIPVRAERDPRAAVRQAVARLMKGFP